MLFIRGVGALLFVLLLILLAAAVLKRMTNRGEDWPVVKVISRQKIGRNAELVVVDYNDCLLYTSPSPRDLSTSRMPSSA